MLEIYITLKSFELLNIEKNISFIKNVYYLLNKKHNLQYKQKLTLQIKQKKIPQEKTFLFSPELRKSLHTNENKFLHTNQDLYDYKDSMENDTGIQKNNETSFTGCMLKKAKYFLNTKKYTHSDKNLNKKINIFAESQTRFPKKRKLYTVLRSVHVYKKSREQFFFTKNITKLRIKLHNFKQILIFLFILKNATLHGVEMQISFTYSSIFSHIKLLK